MISLKDKILGEGILDTTKSGKSGLKDMIEDWLKKNNINQYRMKDDLSISISSELTLAYEVPDYVNIYSANRVVVVSAEALKNLPKNIYYLTLKGITIDDFTPINDITCAVLCITECDIKSLKGIISPGNELIIGNNVQNIAKKDLKKAGVKLNPNKISNIGKLSFDYGAGTIVIGTYDEDYLEKELGKLSMLYKQLLPEMKKFSYKCKPGNSIVYMNIDFLSEDEHPHHISDNSIYINFRYNIDGSVLELGHTGHLELTEKDKQGKYKYYALKGVCDPYYDAGGKKFRAIRLDQFTAKNIFDKTKDWLRDVVDAALEDQGGQLKRRR